MNRKEGFTDSFSYADSLMPEETGIMHANRKDDYMPEELEELKRRASTDSSALAELKEVGVEVRK